MWQGDWNRINQLVLIKQNKIMIDELINAISSFIPLYLKQGEKDVRGKVEFAIERINEQAVKVQRSLESKWSTFSEEDKRTLNEYYNTKIMELVRSMFD